MPTPVTRETARLMIQAKLALDRSEPFDQPRAMPPNPAKIRNDIGEMRDVLRRVITRFQLGTCFIDDCELVERIIPMLDNAVNAHLTQRFDAHVSAYFRSRAGIKLGKS
jgi:hypothetical protein